MLFYGFLIAAILLYITGCIILIRRWRREPVQPDGGFDDRDQCLKEFPADQYEQHPVGTSDEGRQLIVMKAMTSGSMIFGQARWFADGTGMIFVKKQSVLAEEMEI